jgi:hypothetical protein
MSKRKSVGGKTDPNKRPKGEEEVHEVPFVPTLVEDIATARERARQWHEQQMKMRGMRGTTVEERKSYLPKELQIKSEEVPLKATRTRFSRMSEIHANEPKKRDPTKRHSEIPHSRVTRTRALDSAAVVPAENSPPIYEVTQVVMEKSREVDAPVENERSDSVTNVAKTKEDRNDHYGFRTIEQRMNSQPSVLAEIVPREHFSPSCEEVPPELSWISLPYISLFCILSAFVIATLFRTEQCLELILKLKLHLLYSNHLLTEKFGEAPLGLDYTTWISVLGVVFLFSFVL